MTIKEYKKLLEGIAKKHNLSDDSEIDFYLNFPKEATIYSQYSLSASRIYERERKLCFDLELNGEDDFIQNVFNTVLCYLKSKNEFSERGEIL